MSEFKEVWFVWDGMGKPPSGVSGVKFSDGSTLLDDSPLNSYGLSWLNSHQYETEWRYITAYTLGQKRRRCQSYHGAKFHLSFGFGCAPALRVIEHKTPCFECNGSGWEYKQGVE